MANGRCRMHGGKAKRGAEHPNYRGKGRSKYLDSLPKKLRKDYAAALKYEIDLIDELALLDALIVEQASKLGQDEEIHARERIIRFVEQKRKLVETHTRSEEKAGALVNVNQIVLVQDTLVLGIIGVIESGVADADLRAALLGGIQKVWTRNALRAGQPADSGGD